MTPVSVYKYLTSAIIAFLPRCINTASINYVHNILHFQSRFMKQEDRNSRHSRCNKMRFSHSETFEVTCVCHNYCNASDCIILIAELL
jgi:hypothetical protein